MPPASLSVSIRPAMVLRYRPPLPSTRKLEPGKQAGKALISPPRPYPKGNRSPPPSNARRGFRLRNQLVALENPNRHHLAPPRLPYQKECPSVRGEGVSHPIDDTPAAPSRSAHFPSASESPKHMPPPPPGSSHGKSSPQLPLNGSSLHPHARPDRSAC
jgi:hypothetical protein